MLTNFDTFPISPKNCFTFNKNTFDLSIFFEELQTFYNNVGLDRDIYYAHAFNKYGLLYNPYPVKGYEVKKIDYTSLFFNLFSDKDITLATDIENDKFNNYIDSMYKYNILCLYQSILKTIKENKYSSSFFVCEAEQPNNIEVEFYLFISKHCINIPEFDILKDEFLKEYKSL